MKTAAANSKPSFWRSRYLILMFLLLSGSCGLVYEILWMKMLTLVIGNTILSITTVLTAFMGGLALGSFLAGRFIDRIRNPLRTYGILEGGIGLYALLLPFLIAGTEPLLRFVYQHGDPSLYAFNLLRFGVCGILLLIPTTLMGATLPVLSQHFVARPSLVGLNVGLLYGVNTFGAVLGSAAAGFILIPALGIHWTICSAALANLAICGLVLKLAANPFSPAPCGEEQQETKKSKKEGVQELVPQVDSRVILLVMTGIGVSGMAAMIYQVAWNKVLLLAIGSSVYAFSLIVTAFICGLALGSLAVARFIDRRKDLVLGLALVQGTIGIAALFIIPVLGRLPLHIAEFVFDASSSFPHVQLVEFAIIFALILVPTFMMGAAVPMAVKICTPDVRRVGRFFGNVYAVNTVGAIIGSFIAGFLLIPWLGTQKSILIAVTLNLGAGGLLFLHAPSCSSAKRLAGALATLVVALSAWSFTSSWDPFILTSGAYLYMDGYKKTAVKESLDVEGAIKDSRQKLFFKEGFHGVVSVEKTPTGDLSLRVNGKTDATAKGDAVTQLMVGHLPLLLHQRAEDVLVVGLGSGMTVGAVERYPVKAIDVVEIEPAVVEASRYFREFTGDAVNDPRVNLILADGRNHLALTGKTYDVIISEPSNPWVAGMANLFTREYFQLAKGRLRKRGLMCQWVHAYSMSSDDFKTVVRTFHDVFPHMTVWEASLGADYVLIGSGEDMKIDHPMLASRLDDKTMKADLRKMHITDLVSLLGRLLMAEQAIPGYTKGVPLHTDGNGLLEYSAPRALLEKNSSLLVEDLYRHRSNPVSVLQSLGWAKVAASVASELPEVLEGRKKVLAGFTCYVRGAVQDAIQNLEAALVLSAKDYDATYLLAKLYSERGDSFKAERRFGEATEAYRKSIGTVENLIVDKGASFSDYFDLQVLYTQAHLELGIMALNQDRLREAEEEFRRSISGEVRFAETYANLGVVYERSGKFDEAVNHYRQALALNPALVSARMNLGNIRLRQQNYQEAIEIYRQVQKLRPNFAITNYNLGIAYFSKGDLAEAEREFRRALELKPQFAEAQKSLEVVRSKMKSR